MSGIFDFHSHVLPRIDDGSASLEESIALLTMEAEQGIGHVVATPHFYPRHDEPRAFLSRRREAELRLREEMARHSGFPELSIGAEVHFFSGISESEVLPQLTIDSKSCILLEMPQPPWTEAMYRELEQIPARQGITPVIAHVDRYIGPFRTYGIPERLAELPVLVQANASFFLRRTTARMALRMLKEDRIQFLGSDCHDPVSRPPRLGEAVEKIRGSLGQWVLDRIADYQDSAL